MTRRAIASSPLYVIGGRFDGYDGPITLENKKPERNANEKRGVLRPRISLAGGRNWAEKEKERN